MGGEVDQPGPDMIGDRYAPQLSETVILSAEERRIAALLAEADRATDLETQQRLVQEAQFLQAELETRY